MEDTMTRVLIAVCLSLVPFVAAACERPGTPNNLSSKLKWDQRDGYNVQVSFKNTASEPVNWEYNLRSFKIDPVRKTYKATETGGRGGSRPGHTAGWGHTMDFRVAQNEVICVKIRARAIDNDCVSAQWSAPVCDWGTLGKSGLRRLGVRIPGII